VIFAEYSRQPALQARATDIGYHSAILAKFNLDERPYRGTLHRPKRPFIKLCRATGKFTSASTAAVSEKAANAGNQLEGTGTQFSSRAGALAYRTLRRASKMQGTC